MATVFANILATDLPPSEALKVNMLIININAKLNKLSVKEEGN